MALPSSYTDATLAAFMRSELKNLAADLGWAAEPFNEEINDLLIGFKMQGVEEVADIELLRAKARISVWSAAEKATTGDYDTSSQQDADKRSQVHINAKAQRIAAQMALKALLDTRALGDELELQKQQQQMFRSSSTRVTSTW